MLEPSARPLISKRWFQACLLTFLLGFAVLGYLALRVVRDRPPVPDRVTGPAGELLFTGGDVIAGQQLFQRRGLMEYGTIFGHGAYLGPDFTAQYLHEAALRMTAYYTAGGLSPAEAAERVRADLKGNRFDPARGALAFTPGQAAALQGMRSFYGEYFGPHESQRGLQRPTIAAREDIERLTDYFAWAAWVCTTLRPGGSGSYTNNWPAEPAAGNAPTAAAFFWSALSLVALLGGAGLLFFFIGRYDLLGWHRIPEEEATRLQFRPPEEVRLAPAQRATAWYFLVVAALFLAQGLLGGVNAHYHAEPGGFYGIDISRWLPYNLSRTWHLQLALFFVTASYLAMAIFIAPMIAGGEPRGQDKLAIGLFGALVLVVGGSLAGEALSIMGYLPADAPWFWVGHQGWEFLDLGRLWQILLVAGMAIWVLILVRGLRGRLRLEHPANLPWLFVFSALSIPLFYAVGLAFGRNTSFVLVDFWRFWVVHLWVEDFLELFTTIMVAYLFVLLRVVRPAVATRVVYLDIFLYSIGGVIGTMHHLYFSGTPEVHLSLGAFFSAMEVIPLLLLTFEAWRFMRLGGVAGKESVLQSSCAEFPHKWAVMFLVSVGFWNFLGAGVFGFLINLPVVSYYEIGTQFTANHAHGALMGVYGMLACGFFVFVARYFIPPDRGSERAMRTSFWGLNIGLLWMLLVNLIPIGAAQYYDAVRYGYWHARDASFFNSTGVRTLEWLRLPGDLLFIVAGILPLVYLALRMFRLRKRYGKTSTGEKPEDFVQVVEQAGPRDRC